MWLFATLTATGMFLAGMALLIVILLRRSYRYYGRRGSRKRRDSSYLDRTPRPAPENRSLSTAPPDVLRWQVEMQELAREMKADLDSKMRALQILIAQARTEANRLEQLMETSEPVSAGASQRESVPESVPDAEPKLPATAARRAAICALADEGKPPSAIAECIGIPVGEIELILSLRGARPS